jgi:hypothetical protein
MFFRRRIFVKPFDATAYQQGRTILSRACLDPARGREEQSKVLRRSRRTAHRGRRHHRERLTGRSAHGARPCHIAKRIGGPDRAEAARRERRPHSFNSFKGLVRRGSARGAGAGTPAPSSRDASADGLRPRLPFGQSAGSAYQSHLVDSQVIKLCHERHRK